MDENGSHHFKYMKISLPVNKRSAITIAVIVIAVIAVGAVAVSKAMLGDSKTELPGEEGAEKALHVQESNNTTNGPASTNAESSESGP